MNQPTILDTGLLRELEAHPACKQGNDQRIEADPLLGSSADQLRMECRGHSDVGAAACLGHLEKPSRYAILSEKANRPRTVVAAGGMAKGWWS